MKTIRTSTLFTIAAGLAAAVALVATRNITLPVVGTFEVLASAIALAGFAILFGRDTASRPAAQGLRLTAAATPPAARAVSSATRHPLGVYGPRAVVVRRRRERALVAAA